MFVYLLKQLIGPNISFELCINGLYYVCNNTTPHNVRFRKYRHLLGYATQCLIMQENQYGGHLPRLCLKLNSYFQREGYQFGFAIIHFWNAE